MLGLTQPRVDARSHEAGIGHLLNAGLEVAARICTGSVTVPALESWVTWPISFRPSKGGLANVSLVWVPATLLRSGQSPKVARADTLN